MTRDEAITRLKNMAWLYGSAEREQNIEAIDMAISALQADTVSREDTVTLNSPISIQADMVSVVRCKDCLQKHIGGSVTHYYWCDRWDMEVDDTDYCAWGERKEE